MRVGVKDSENERDSRKVREKGKETKKKGRERERDSHPIRFEYLL